MYWLPISHHFFFLSISKQTLSIFTYRLSFIIGEHVSEQRRSVPNSRPSSSRKVSQDISRVSSAHSSRKFSPSPLIGGPFVENDGGFLFLFLYFLDVLFYCLLKLYIVFIVRFKYVRILC